MPRGAAPSPPSSQLWPEQAFAAISRSDYKAAVSASRQAHELNPFSVEPLWAWALAETARRTPDATLRRYRQATELQPENSDTWYALGAYELSLRRYRSAFRALDRAYALDPYGPAGLPGGLLDQAREKVNEGLG